MTLLDLKSLIENADRELAHRKGKRDIVFGNLQRIQSQIQERKSELECEKQVQDIFNKTSSLTWNRTKGRIESIVVRALKAVYPERSYQFFLEQETKRGTSSVKFVLQEGDISIDVWNDGGLGVASVIGFALRVAYLALYRPKLRQLLFLDEAFLAVGEKNTLNLIQFIRIISMELGIQIVLVTHNPKFSEASDQVFTVQKSGDDCVVMEETIRA